MHVLGATQTPRRPGTVEQTEAFWLLNISYLYIGLIPPVCTLTKQMRGEIWSGLSMSL